MRDSRFTFLCTPDERRMLVTVAEKLQRSQGDAVRFLVREASRDLAADATPAQPATPNNTPANGKKSPWRSGSFYLAGLVVILALLAAISTNVHGLDLVVVITGGLLSIIMIGALQLRQDEGISETNFLKLMIESFKRLPLLRGNNQAASASKGKAKSKSR